MFVCCECCVFSGRGLCDGADHSSRRVLPTVARRCVWSRNLVNEEAMAHCGAVAPKTNSTWYALFIIIIIIMYLSWRWATCWPVPVSRI